MEVFTERAPVLAEFHAGIGEEETPRPGPEEGVEVEFAPRHASDARRESDERADHGQHAGDENCGISPTMKKTLGGIEFAAPHENPAAIAFNQRTTAVIADLVRHEGAEIASDRTGRRDPEQLHRAFKDEVAGKRHDEFGG